jgi:hypothetical protein
MKMAQGIFAFVWLLMAISGMVAMFFNPAHIVTFVCSAILCYVFYNESKYDD